MPEHPSKPVNTPFENQTFRRLFAAQITSLIGSGFTQVALALLAFDLMGLQAAAVLGIVWSSRVLASVIFAPIFGGLVHSLPRKPWLISLDIGRAALVLSLFWVEDVRLLYLLIFLINVLSAGFTPVFQATLPDVLPDENQYTRALSYSRLAYELERMLSPALAGLALLLVSYHALFLLNALSFVVSAAVLALTVFPRAVVGERVGGIWHNIAFGINGYLRTPRLQGLLALQLVVAATGAMVIINTVAYVQGDLGLSEQATVWVMAAAGVGAMLAARLTPWLLENHFNDRNLTLFAGGLMLLPLLPLVFSQPEIMTLAILWAVIGFASSLVLTTAGRLVTRSCRKADRSAYFSANFALSHLMWLICYPLAGWWGKQGADTAALGLGLVGLFGLVIAIWRWPAQDVEALKHRHPKMDHQHPHYHDEHHQHEHEGWEGEEPHVHPHHHHEIEHRHRFVIDEHHGRWPEQPVVWRKLQKQRMKQSDTMTVLKELESYCEAPTRPDTEAPVRAAYRYLSNRRDQLDYQGALEQALPIGSGAIESAHRYIIQERLKLPGAGWNAANAESMLALRVERANQGWQDYWQEFTINEAA